MRYKAVFLILFSLFLGTANATWKKISDVNYTWGPFNIYHITLFSETGRYVEGTRPLMLTLQYKKPWEGRDFAASLARSWHNLGIKLPEQQVDEVITRLRKTFPDIKPEDTLHYIALEDRGYFILNDQIVSDMFHKQFNDAIVAIWLDPKMDISRQLLDPSYRQKAEERNMQKAVEQPKVEKSQDNVQEINIDTHQVNHQIENLSTKEADSNAAQINREESLSHTKSENLANNKEENNAESKTEEKSKIIKIENPEVLILPIYDDFLMLKRHNI